MYFQLIFAAYFILKMPYIYQLCFMLEVLGKKFSLMIIFENDGKDC